MALPLGFCNVCGVRHPIPYQLDGFHKDLKTSKQLFDSFGANGPETQQEWLRYRKLVAKFTGRIINHLKCCGRRMELQFFHRYYSPVNYVATKLFGWPLSRVMQHLQGMFLLSCDNPYITSVVLYYSCTRSA